MVDIIYDFTANGSENHYALRPMPRVSLRPTFHHVRKSNGKSWKVPYTVVDEERYTVFLANCDKTNMW